MRIRTLLALMAVAILLPVVLAAGIALDQIREGERTHPGSARDGARHFAIVDREAGIAVGRRRWANRHR
jgi:hypothetical protein